MAESGVMFGLKIIAKHFNISVPKVKRLFKKGMPHTRDESGMYVTTKEQCEKWFKKRIMEKQKN